MPSYWLGRRRIEPFVDDRCRTIPAPADSISMLPFQYAFIVYRPRRGLGGQRAYIYNGRPYVAGEIIRSILPVAHSALGLSRAPAASALRRYTPACALCSRKYTSGPPVGPHTAPSPHNRLFITALIKGPFRFEFLFCYSSWDFVEAFRVL